MKTSRVPSAERSACQHSPIRRFLYAVAPLLGQPHDSRTSAGTVAPAFSNAGLSRSASASSHASRVVST